MMLQSFIRRSKMDEFHALIKKHFENKEQEKFIHGKTKIHYSGPIFDYKEVNAVLDSLLGGWLAEGKQTMDFEKEFAKFIDVKECVVVNSGSSALLLAFLALMNKSLDNPIKKGDEVITASLTFPTTLNAILLNNLVPVFVDVDRKSYNMKPEFIKEMISDKTKAILVTHHLGNPCDMDKIMDIAKKHNLYVIEDCCDAHGSEYKGKKLGSFGDMSCFSFYCAHAMTMGEGGAILTNNSHYRSIIMSLKTCGRACVCPVCNLTIDPNFKCNLRWDSDIKGFEGFDKRTLYTDIGYKFKILDLQSAFGLEQLKKLPGFIEARQNNFNFIVNHLSKYSKYLQLPVAAEDSKPSWFSLPITIKENAPFKRKKLTEWLEKRNIETRPLLGGNLIKQPAYKDIKFRSMKLENTDYLHNNSFYLGCYPGITKEMLEFIIKSFDEFFENVK